MIDKQDRKQNIKPTVVAVGRRDTPLEVAMTQHLDDVSAMLAAIAAALSKMLNHCATAVMLLEGQPERLTLANGANLTRLHTKALMMLKSPELSLIKRLEEFSVRQDDPIIVQQGRVRWSLIPLVKRWPGRQETRCLGAILFDALNLDAVQPRDIAGGIVKALNFGLNYHNWRLDSDALQGDAYRLERETLPALLKGASDTRRSLSARAEKLMERAIQLDLTLEDLCDELDQLQETIGPDGESLSDDWQGHKRQLRGHHQRLNQSIQTLRGCTSLLAALPTDEVEAHDLNPTTTTLISTP